jgi:DNA-directed RNA polymerase specialized sigma24 family protein
MAAISCKQLVDRASESLDDVLDGDTKSAIGSHLDACDDCPTYLTQLRTTIGVLRDRPGIAVPADLQAAIDDAMAGLAERDAAEHAASEHGEQLLATATAIDPGRADDLVQQTWVRAFDEGTDAFTLTRLVEILSDVAGDRDVSGSAEVGSLHDITATEAGRDRLDPDADTAALFYPDFYTDGPDAGAWIEPPNSWPADTRILSPDADVETGELYGIVDDAIGELPSFESQVITLIDIEGLLADHVALSLDRSSRAVHDALHAARNHVRGRIDTYLTNGDRSS